MSRHAIKPLPSGGSVPESWKSQSISIWILRAFLGVTFLYAGVQKLSDGNFLHAGSVNYIGSQLQAFSEGTPIGGLLRFLAAHLAVATGIGIALLEIAIGLGTLLGIAPFLWAAAGFLVNFVLFLSASWHVHPYFLGSDSIYAVAWAAYLVALSEIRQKAIRAAQARRAVRRADSDQSRRQFIRGGVVAAATFFLGGIAKAMAGKPTLARGSGLGGTRVGVGPGRTTGTKSKSGGTSSSGGGNHHTHQHQASGPQVIGDLSQVPVGGAIGFQGPQGIPGALVRLGKEDVAAFSRVCTHAGCLVGYDPNARLLVCPCHGAEYDPAKGARVVAGPAPSPLPKIPVKLNPKTGRITLA